MKTSASNILFHELIRLKATIVESSDGTLKGLSGEIVDETKRTLKIRSVRGLKTVPKEIVTLKIEMPDGASVTIEGRKIAYRPEDRIKRMGRRR